MTALEIEREILRLRKSLKIRNRDDLEKMFSSWSFQDEEQEEEAYRLDRLEFLAA